jgi:hypothetical protein
METMYGNKQQCNTCLSKGNNSTTKDLKIENRKKNFNEVKNMTVISMKSNMSCINS